MKSFAGVARASTRYRTRVAFFIHLLSLASSASSMGHLDARAAMHANIAPAAITNMDDSSSRYAIVLLPNTWHASSVVGTLGPKSESYVRCSRKGDRTLTRSRLEVCPAAASFCSALGKPKLSYWQSASNLRSCFHCAIGSCGSPSCG